MVRTILNNFFFISLNNIIFLDFAYKKQLFYCLYNTIIIQWISYKLTFNTFNEYKS